MSDRKTHAAKFNRYTVTLELYTEDGQPRSDCHIEYRNFCASLGCADGEGALHDYDNGATHKIDQGSLDQIRAWAEGLGY